MKKNKVTNAEEEEEEEGEGREENGEKAKYVAAVAADDDLSRIGSVTAMFT